MKRTELHFAAVVAASFVLSSTYTFAQANQPGATTPASTEKPASTGAPKIVFATNIFDFGTVKQGEVVRHDFIFTNTGTATLEITQVKPGCGCTTAGTWDKLVEPGKTGSIPLQFNSSGFGGKVGKSATVTCNDPANSNIVLQLSGTVWKPVDITPTMAMFNFGVEDAAEQTKTLRIVSNLQEPLQLSDLQSSNPAFKLALKTVKEGKEFELEITTTPPTNGPTVFANLTLKTSSTNVPTLTATAYATVQPLLSIFPQMVMIPAGPLTNVFNSQINIRANSTNSIKLSEPTIDIPGA